MRTCRGQASAPMARRWRRQVCFCSYLRFCLGPAGRDHIIDVHSPDSVNGPFGDLHTCASRSSEVLLRDCSRLRCLPRMGMTSPSTNDRSMGSKGAGPACWVSARHLLFCAPPDASMWRASAWLRGSASCSAMWGLPSIKRCRLRCRYRGTISIASFDSGWRTAHTCSIEKSNIFARRPITSFFASPTQARRLPTSSLVLTE
jgi:hypothetical protein